MERELRYSENVCKHCQEIKKNEEQGIEPEFRAILAAAMHHRMSRFLANEEGLCPSTRETSAIEPS